MRKCACRFAKERLFKSTFTRGAMQKKKLPSEMALMLPKAKKKAASNGTIVITTSYILQISQNIYVLE